MDIDFDAVTDAQLENKVQMPHGILIHGGRVESSDAVRAHPYRFLEQLDGTGTQEHPTLREGHDLHRDRVSELFARGKDSLDVREAELVNDVGVQESGNTVGLAEEMTKSGEIKRQYELNAALVKSFHRMMLMTVKR